MREADVIVVGAGAAGIIAAWRAATLGARVLIAEKTPRIGTKILISGGGKCNVTHAGPIEAILKAFRPEEARFLRASFYRFTNQDWIDILESRGLQLMTRPNGRVFPATQNAKAVVSILRAMLSEAGVELVMNCPVKGILVQGSTAVGVVTESEPIMAKAVIVAAGGSSYPTTGTTGDAWPWLTSLGHGLVPVRAALAPILLAEPVPLPGISLRDVTLKARQNGKVFRHWRDDLLFTHKGVSGPTALEISREVAEKLECGKVSLEIDLAPNRSFEELKSEILEWIRVNPKRSVGWFIEQFVPKNAVALIAADSQIDPEQASSQVTQKARNRLIEVLKGWQLGQVVEAWLEKGEVVAGGIPLDEIDPQTMASAKAEELYLCGECLDISGPIGGYNLQAAFSTGYVAGESAAKQAKA